MNIDPLAEKYFKISPFVHVANNPLVFVDPDGRKLVLAGNRREVRKNLRQIRKLTNNRLKINKNTGVVSVSKGRRNRSKSLTRGTSLVSNLIKSPRTTTVSSTSKFRKDNKGVMILGKDLGNTEGNHALNVGPNSLENQSNGTGADALVLMEHDSDKKVGDIIVNEDGSKGRPEHIGMAHELLHAENIINGVVDDGDISDDIQDPDTMLEGTLSPEEISIRESENVIRDEQKVKLRMSPIDNMLKKLKEFLKNN